MSNFMDSVEETLKEKMEEAKTEIFDEIHGSIEEHMKRQPYNIVCEECGEDLKNKATFDTDMDLSISVTPCDCTSKPDE